MTQQTSEQHFDTVVIGGGQAGLAMGYFLARQDRDFVILDAGDRVGQTWRKRWDSLRLFTPSFHDGLPGMPFPAPANYFPTKDETADYLEAYASKFALPVRFGRHVDSLTRHDDGYLVSAGYERYVTEHVVVATGPYQHPKIPSFAAGLDPKIVQLHSSAYRHPNQLPKADVLVVGAGNSGAEISVDLAATRHTYLSGRNAGYIPISLIHNRLSLWLADRVLTTDTRLGRKMSEAHRDRGAPLVRLKPKEIAAAGVELVPRVESVVNGKPRLADGRVLDVTVVVWATGFRLDFGWIELPIFDDGGYPIHHRGVVDAAPGLYFLGLPFQYTPTSEHVGGVGNDARYISEHIAVISPSRPARRRDTHLPMDVEQSALVRGRDIRNFEFEKDFRMRTIGMIDGMSPGHEVHDGAGLLQGKTRPEHGIEVIGPDEEKRRTVYDVIYDELCLGEVKESSGQANRRIMSRLVERSAETMIMGCTEITMLVGQEDASVPLFDTTAIHAKKAVEMALD
jgi:putative flavoprotein involved in K+ transport